MNKGWGIYPSGKFNHVIPEEDLLGHALTNCWCNPTLDDYVMIHHSLDEREDSE